jgi:hypothetical protein
MIGRDITDTDWDTALHTYEEARGEGVARLLRSGDPEVAFERSEFLREQPWRVFAAQVEQRIARLRTARMLRWTAGFAGLGFIFSAAVALFVFTGPTVLTAQSEIRAKGVGYGSEAAKHSGTLRLFVGGKQVVSSAPLAPGSELRFEVDTKGYDHVFIFGEEADGTATPYYPDDPAEGSLLIGIGRGLMLPDSVQLDDALGRECMFAVFSKSRLTWAQVQQLRNQVLFAREGITMEQVCFEKRP